MSCDGELLSIAYATSFVWDEMLRLVDAAFDSIGVARMDAKAEQQQRRQQQDHHLEIFA